MSSENMNKEALEAVFDVPFSPKDCVSLMFERTLEDGTLYLPAWHYDGDEWNDEEVVYRCRMQWDAAQAAQAAEDADRIHRALCAIAAQYDALQAEDGDPAALLSDADALQVYHTYFDELPDGGFDPNKVDAIYEKLDHIRFHQESQKLARTGLALGFMADCYADVTVSEEEEAYYERYVDHLHQAGAQRMGEGLYPFDAYMRAKRLCRLYSLGAPEIVIRRSGYEFVAAFVLHRHGLSREDVVLSADG